MINRFERTSEVNRFFGKFSTLLAVLVFAAVGLPNFVSAQQAKPPLPVPAYYSIFSELYSGEYKNAVRGIKSLQRGSYTDGNGKFMDSVCYWTQMGECYYRVGDYQSAMEQYGAALDLYLSLQSWSARAQMPSELRPSQSAARNAERVTWATSSRGATYGEYQGAIQLFLGKTDAENEGALRRGGTFDKGRLRRVDMAEVMRCVALAVHRRHQILGPAASIDPYNKKLTSQLVGNGGATVATAWSGIAKGFAYSAAGEGGRASQLFRSSLRISGADHPLTPLALMGLGEVSARANKKEEAQQYFLDASIAAAAYEQYDLIEECLYNASTIHSSNRTMTPYEPLLRAIEWANNTRATGGIRLDPLRASLLITAAYVAAEAGDAKTAENFLGNAKGRMSRNDLRLTHHQTRWFYVNSLVRYLKNDVRNGDKQFASFLSAARKTSPWLYQIGMADAAVIAGNTTDRLSEQLYDVLLQEANETDWTYRPIDSMAFTATPHFEPMERWFEITLGRKAEEKAIEISELIRRQRFFSNLPFGGRLMSLRWVLEAAPEALSEKSRLSRDQIMARFPDYKAMSSHSADLRAALAKLPIQPDAKSPERVEQKKLLAQLADVSEQQELALRKLLMTREAIELTFPQPMSMTEIQSRMKSKQTIISILKIGSVYYVMNVGGNSYFIENKIQARVFEKQILDLLKSIGVADKATVIDSKVFLNEDWKEKASEMSSLIFARSGASALEDIEELIIVPDGKAWYLPMEVLQVGTKENSTSLIENVRVRYAPTMSLAVPDDRKTRRFRRSGVIANRNFIRDDSENIKGGLAELQTAIPDIETLDKTVQGPSSLLSSTIDRLIVWHLSSEKARNDPFLTAPFQVDEAKAGTDLGTWMQLPWQGVDHLILPGFSTAIEGSSRGRANGRDLFLTTMGLLASGNRTTLISRWRVGGQSTMDLTREFSMELGKMPASIAWQRSLKLFLETELDVAVEPRVREKVLEEPLLAKHPFFWSGYMLIDNGNDPNAANEEEEAEGGE